MDFEHADQAPTAVLNAILWKDSMGDKPLPAQLKHPAHTAHKEDDDD